MEALHPDEPFPTIPDSPPLPLGRATWRLCCTEIHSGEKKGSWEAKCLKRLYRHHSGSQMPAGKAPGKARDPGVPGSGLPLLSWAFTGDVGPKRSPGKRHGDGGSAWTPKSASTVQTLHLP